MLRALSEAFDFVEAMTAQLAHVRVEPGARHLALVRRLCADADATRELVPDVVLGAVAVEHGAVVATLDRDLARFDSAPAPPGGRERRVVAGPQPARAACG
jgi:uncharacterized protein